MGASTYLANGLLDHAASGATNLSRAATPGGEGINWNATANTYYTVNDLHGPVWGDFTLMYGYRSNGNIDPAPDDQYVFYMQNGGSQYVVLGPTDDGSLDSERLQLRSSTDDTTYGTSLLTDGELHHSAASRRVGGNIEIVVDGLVETQVADSEGTITFSGSPTIHIGDAPGATEQLRGTLLYLYGWDHALPADLIRRIQADPFGMFRPWRPITVGGGGPTTHPLAGTLGTTVALGGGIEVQRALGGDFDTTVSLSGTLEVQGEGLAGSLVTALALGGSLDIGRALAATWPLTLLLEGSLEGPTTTFDAIVSDAPLGAASAEAAAVGAIAIGDTSHGTLEVNDG